MDNIVDKIDKYKKYVSKCKMLGTDYFSAKLNLVTDLLEIYEFNRITGTEKMVIPSLFDSISEKAFNKTMIIYESHNIKEVYIGNHIKSIGDDAFNSMRCIEKVSVGARYIGKNAFKNCFDLKELNIDTGVLEIGKDAFYGCNKLNTIRIEEGLKIIGESAFERCRLRNEVILPNTLEQIEALAFADSGLKRIIIPEGVKYIGNYSFASCNLLEYIEIPDSVEYLGENLFGGTFISDARVIKIKCSEEVFEEIENDGGNIGVFERVQ